MSTSLGSEYAVQKKTKGWLTTVTIMLLIWLPLVGLGCMWQYTDWSKKVKTVITVCSPVWWAILVLGA
jgi:hypothetical protein